MRESTIRNNQTCCVLGDRDLLTPVLLDGLLHARIGVNENTSKSAPRSRITQQQDWLARQPRHRSATANPIILVVEDDIQVRDLTAAILRNEGFEIVTASDAVEVLALSDDELDTIDLLVADVKIPGLDGPTLAHRLSERRSGLKVVFMSAWVDPAASNPALPAEPPFLAKPFGYDDLVSLVRTTLQQQTA